MALSFDDALQERLFAALPNGLSFTIHHLCSEPTACAPIFPPAPDHIPEETFCESQFLSVAIDVNGSKVQAFALEVLIYSTEVLTTLFVSKADSTGYLHLLKLSPGVPSPLKTTISIFLKLLVERKWRPGVRLVLSLFARAQDQYLFPGSIENSEKHVLDDRELIRWWCHILNGILQSYPVGETSVNSEEYPLSERDRVVSRGFLRVPGCDANETRAFFPDYAKRQSSSTSRWLASDPLRSLGKAPGIPERCLIPRFPDDPKARFVVDLDDELPENGLLVTESPSKSQLPGKWRSVKSLEQFWDMMAFRQECAAGRLVGFIWGVFTPVGLVDRPFDTSIEDNQLSEIDKLEEPFLPTPLDSQVLERPLNRPQSSLRSSSPQLGLLLSPLPSSQPQGSDLQLDIPRSSCSEILSMQPVTAGVHDTKAHAIQVPTSSTIATPPLSVSLPIYNRIVSLLQQLDYANLTLATQSTLEWLTTASAELDWDDWGVAVTGRKEVLPLIRTVAANETTPTVPVMLSSGLLRKKKRSGTVMNGSGEDVKGTDGVAILSAGAVRKKLKT
ncbi:hypothetical protein MMC34_005290 [Xylographa carneopallida]|nr:hypothetical protein [Xylographa carneopallida]